MIWRRAPGARFAGIGVAALAVTALCSGCGEAVTSTDVAVAEPSAAPKAAPGPTQHHDHDHARPSPVANQSLDLPRRVARLSGHVAAGLALYRGGEPAAAAAHLQHPISDHHAAEREGLDALGLDKAPFERVNVAIAAGKPAAEVADLVDAVESHLLDLAARAGGDPLAIIRDLVATALQQYEVAVPENSVASVGPYQDAFGFTVVALTHAQSIKGEAGDALRMELATLRGLWPDVPLPPAKPATLAAVRDQVNRIRDVLRYAR